MLIHHCIETARTVSSCPRCSVIYCSCTHWCSSPSRAWTPAGTNLSLDTPAERLCHLWSYRYCEYFSSISFFWARSLLSFCPTRIRSPPVSAWSLTKQEPSPPVEPVMRAVFFISAPPFQSLVLASVCIISEKSRQRNIISCQHYYQFVPNWWYTHSADWPLRSGVV